METTIGGTNPAGGFFNISGGAVDSHGNFMFDAHVGDYRWDSGQTTACTNDVSFEPVYAVVDRAGNLMVHVPIRAIERCTFPLDSSNKHCNR